MTNDQQYKPKHRAEESARTDPEPNYKPRHRQESDDA